MNNIAKKRTIVVLVLYISILNIQKVYGITDKFKFVIDTIGIPRYNVYGKEINEEIYNAYNVFSYGWPEELASKEGQRWKDSKYGLWSKGTGAYTGSGIRGEYNLLGKDYSGNIINNYYFPVDTLPETTPENWVYYSNPGASSSWNDKNKYKYIEQLEYMKNTKLMFNDISSKDNSDNPEKIKEYNITAKMIGFDKARLDVCSTWKTNGIIHTRRKVNGQIRYAVFLTKPMAANADIKSTINVNKNIVMKSTEDKINIDIEYGANIVNMTGYAKEAHIKEIVSKLSINEKEVDEISGSKTNNVGKKYTLTLTREELVEEKNNIIKVVNNSYSHTEFAVDGLMQNSVEMQINVFVEKEEIIPVKTSEVKILEKDNETLVVRPLAQSNIIKEESLGITEAGRYIVLKLNLNDKIKVSDLENIKVLLNNEQIKQFEIMSSKLNKSLVIKLKIPDYTASTIYGWKSLREIYGNYFNINKEEIGKRINEPHNLEVKVTYLGKEYMSLYKLDTIDDYITNINYSFNVDNDTYNSVQSLEQWIE